MKVLTNVHKRLVGGIHQAVSSLASRSRSKDVSLKLVGVAIDSAASEKGTAWTRFRERGLRGWARSIEHTPLSDIIRDSQSLEELENKLEPIIEAYADRIDREKPDLVLINGTYYLPWCLMRAASERNIPFVVHYHGSITKETEHWKEPERRELMKQMEQSFLSSEGRYIFNSQLAKRTVEKDVFGKEIENATVIPNPLPDIFFKAPAVKSRRHVGVVSRWARIKNTAFVSRFAKLNARRGAQYVINAITDLERGAPITRDLSGLVRFHRPRENAALASFYGRMGAVLCPSYFETYGNVAQEAVATGTPALVSNKMGIAEVFDRVGLERFIVNFGSPAHVHDSVGELAARGVTSDERRRLQEETAESIICNNLSAYLKA